MSTKSTRALLAAAFLAIMAQGAAAGTNTTQDEWCLKHGMLKGCTGLSTSNHASAEASKISNANTPSPKTVNTQSTIFDRWGYLRKAPNSSANGKQSQHTSTPPGTPK